MTEVIIKVQDGRVQDVHVPGSRKIRVRVMDFDVYDEEHGLVKFDRQGRPYEEAVW
jgi:hypothetical protein